MLSHLMCRRVIWLPPGPETVVWPVSGIQGQTWLHESLPLKHKTPFLAEKRASIGKIHEPNAFSC